MSAPNECCDEAGSGVVALRGAECLLLDLTGGAGRFCFERRSGDDFYLRFDEAFIEALLSSLGLEPLKPRCRPSLISGRMNLEEARLRLARRARAALGVGSASRFGTADLDSSGLDCQLEVSLSELQELPDRLCLPA